MLGKGSKTSTESLSPIKRSLVQSCSCFVLFTLLTVFQMFMWITSEERTTSHHAAVLCLKLYFEVYSLFTDIKAKGKKIKPILLVLSCISPNTNITHLREFPKTDWHVILNKMLFWTPSYPRREEVSLQWSQPDLILSASSRTLLAIE